MFWETCDSMNFVEHCFCKATFTETAKPKSKGSYCMCYIEKLQQLFKKEKNNQGMLSLTITEMIIECVCVFILILKNPYGVCVYVYICV